MKFKFIIFVSVFVGAQCHVLLETQTKRVVEEDIGNGSNRDIHDTKDPKKSTTVKTVLSEVHRVYLEDVLYNLRNQNWTMGEEPCFNQTLQMLKSLQNFTLWAVWEWDSIASEPSGLLFGNLYQLGNFDECLGAPWVATYPELRNKYCLTKIRLESTHNRALARKTNEPYNPYSSALDFIQDVPLHSRPLNEITWGACVPTSCGPESVKRLLSVMLARSHLGTAGIVPHITVEGDCQTSDEPMKFDWPFYAFVILVTLLIATALVCTFWNNMMGSRTPNIIKTFCLRENAADLLKMRKDGIEILYGIRFLSISFIVIDHQFGFVSPVAVRDGRVVDRATMTPVAMLVLHDDLFVDTFFFLSGFLVAINMLMLKNFPNPLLIILKRYIRLVAGFALIVFFMAAALPYVGDGPLWPRMAETEQQACRDNWWLNLLMLNNYVNTENMCILVAWYIPCDFHFFVLTVLIFWIYKKYPFAAKVLGGVLAVASIVVPGLINYYNDLPAVQLFTYEFLKNPRASEQFQSVYIKSHTRIAAYIVGIIGGCIYTSYKNGDNVPRRLNLKWSIFGAAVGVAVMLMIMFLGWTFLFGLHKPLENAVYAALNRPVWAAGLLLLVLSCALGRVPLVKGFLSWYPWVPLSRLSYGLYLTHSILIFRNVFVTRNPGHYNYSQLLNESIGVIFWGCIAAFAMWLLVEAPANRLFILLMKSIFVKAPPHAEGKVGTQSTNNLVTCDATSTDPSAIENKGHLQDNIPATIQFSSKI